MNRRAAKIIALLFCNLLFSINLSAQVTKILKRSMTNSEFEKFKNLVGTFEEGKNYNLIINGHGTGLRPPTEKQWADMKNQAIIVDKLEFTNGTTTIPLNYDNSATNWFPPIGNQGSEGSCVSWACGYYTKTFQEAREHNWDLSACTWVSGHPIPDYQDKIFSPDFIYHQVNNGGDNGSYYSDDMNLLQSIGCCTWNKMPNSTTDHTSWPTEDAWRQAPWYRSQTGFGYMSINTDQGIANLKQYLADGNLVIISLDAGFYSNLTSQDLWTLDNYNPSGTNHANTIVGYDDNYGPFTESGNSNKYGAFKVANSWGVGGWEKVADGFYYISYECLKQRMNLVYLYQNYVNYIPKMVAVFEINHYMRGENQIGFGIGDPAAPYNYKSFNDFIYKGGNIPFPDNPIVIDISEFISGLNNSDQFFLKDYDGGTSATGTIDFFSVEKYDDYANGIPANVYTSTETPLNTQQSNNVYANLFISSETIYITYPAGGEVFNVGSNPTITYNSKGTSGYLNFDYSTDRGTTWFPIASNAADNGHYADWVVPNTPSVYCKIRISDADGNPSIISKGLFRIGQEEFTEQTSIPLTGVQYSSAAWGDYNNDGYLDILLTGDSKSKIYKNNGNNTFTEQTSISLDEVFEPSVAWGDYDNDGDLDILLTGSGESIIYRNNGNNTFTKQAQIKLEGVFEGSAAWGDYNNDGNMDILLTGHLASGKTISKIYRNNGENAFVEQTSIVLSGVWCGSIAWGDYDNDGDLDILLTGCTSISGSDLISKIYQNNGNNTFTELTSISLIGVVRGSARWGDYDNDGDLDILITGSGSSTIVYRNDGDNTFTEQASISIIGVEYSSAAWGDYDNDGDLDILLSGNHLVNGQITGISKIYQNKGNNSFGEQTSISFIGVGNGSTVAWGDYDNDGDLDILLTGNSKSGPISKIYRNNCTKLNILPSAPSNLKTVLNGNDVIFSWDKSTDAETPQNGLTYNIIIGTTPGACNILSPMSDRNTGRRRVISFGNAGHLNNKIIKNLPNGRYYWSVQAIDNTFAGSKFSEEQSFSIPNIFSDTEPASLSTPIHFNEGGSDPGDGHEIAMNFTALNGSGNITVNQTNTTPQNSPGKNVCGYFWEFSKGSGITSFTTNITFHYSDNDVAGYNESSASLGIAKFNSTTNSWQWLGGNIDPNNNTITVNGVTSFSTFALFRRIFGDYNGDGYVDAADLQKLGDCWHSKSISEFQYDTDARFFNFNKNTDDGDQIIDAADLQVFGDCWHNGIK